MRGKLDPATAQALRQLDLHLNPVWDLGRNAVLAWTPRRPGLEVLVLSVHELLRSVSQTPALLQGTRYQEERRFREIVDLVGGQPTQIESSLRIGPLQSEVPWQTVERVIRRYSITETANRAVVLFDIVGFSKLDPIQQIGQLNTLESAINVADRAMRAFGLDVEFARSTTGDGFYVWNRRLGILADLNLLALMVLALGENAVAAGMDRAGLVPRLRTVFSIGQHFSYHQIEGLSPRGYEYIVGNVTISLARLMAHAAPGQILVGEFERPVRDDQAGEGELVTTAKFVDRCEKLFKRLIGLELGRQKVTGLRFGLGGFEGRGPERVYVEDKHGFGHVAYNASASIQRGSHIPVFLGYDPQSCAAETPSGS